MIPTSIWNWFACLWAWVDDWHDVLLVVFTSLIFIVTTALAIYTCGLWRSTKRLVKDAKKINRRVYCIAFPVDYWNKLGWTEPHGDPNHTKRQQEYSKAVRTDQIYTPQMIVNGTEEFVGSSKPEAQKSIAAALGQKAATAVTLRMDKPTGANGVTIAYEISSAPKNAVLNVAVVESGLVSKVTRGENSGRTLAHDNVVRVFTTVAIDRSGKGTVDLKLPNGLVRKKSQVIAYVQHPETKAIVGATAVDLDPGK